LQCVFADRLIDNVYASSLRNPPGGLYEVFDRVIDHVMTTETSSNLCLRLGADGADHNGSEMPRPGTEDMADAASSGMDQNVVSRLHPVRPMQEILRGHSLQD
jgi:hypothetical protein